MQFLNALIVTKLFNTVENHKHAGTIIDIVKVNFLFIQFRLCWTLRLLAKILHKSKAQKLQKRQQNNLVAHQTTMTMVVVALPTKMKKVQVAKPHANNLLLLKLHENNLMEKE